MLFRSPAAIADLPSLGGTSTAFRDGDGPILDLAAAVALMRERCPECGGEEGGMWIIRTLSWLTRSIPLDAYGTFETADTVVWGALGLACILLTFPVVRRRRVG